LVTASTLLRLRAIPVVRQKVLHGSQQEGSKPATLLLQTGQRLLLQKTREEFLRDILRLLRRISATAHVSVERTVVGEIQGRKRFLAELRARPRGLEDRGP